MAWVARSRRVAGSVHGSDRERVGSVDGAVVEVVVAAVTLRLVGAGEAIVSPVAVVLAVREPGRPARP